MDEDQLLDGEHGNDSTNTVDCAVANTNNGGTATTEQLNQSQNVQSSSMQQKSHSQVSYLFEILWSRESRLIDAVMVGDLTTASRLLDKGVDVNSRNDKWPNNSALQIASQCSQVEMVKFLLTRGADINAVTRLDGTVLHSASKSSDIQMVELLLDQGADVNIQDLNGYPALFQAALWNQWRVMPILLDNGADINAKGREDVPPQRIAASHCHEKSVQLLLQRGANVDSPDESGDTPLRWTIRSWLLRFARDSYYKQTLVEKAFVGDEAVPPKYVQLVIESSKYEAMTKLLVNAGASVYKTDSDGENLLSLLESVEHRHSILKPRVQQVLQRVQLESYLQLR